MMFMTSHRVRQPIANILGFSSLLEQYINSPTEIRQSVDSIKQSALTLDSFTKELSLFICNLGRKEKK